MKESWEESGRIEQIEYKPENKQTAPSLNLLIAYKDTFRALTLHFSAFKILRMS
jgi:hypothetical protein